MATVISGKRNHRKQREYIRSVYQLQPLEKMPSDTENADIEFPHNTPNIQYHF